MISNEVKEYFPHETIRAGQDQLIVDTDLAFQENKILLAHAPTGLGKTASALSVALKYALEKDKIVFFLTNRHTQHQIAVETLRLIKNKINVDFNCVDLIGKRWMCNHDVARLFGGDFNEYCKSVVERRECEFYSNIKTKKGLSVPAQAIIKKLQKQGPLHNEELIRIGKEEKICSYELALALAKKAKIIIGDYYYLFNPFVQATLFNKLEFDLEDVIVIVDEGHNLPTRITEMLSNDLTSNIIKNAILEAKKFGYKGMISWLQELMNILNKIADFPADDFGKEKLVRKEIFIDEVNKVISYDELLTELELAADEIRKKQRRSYLGGIFSFLDAWQGDDQGFTRIISEKRSKYGPMIVLSYACLDPSIISKNIFNQVNCGLIMSGTLKPTSMYKDILGIDKGIGKEYSSPFPVENKLSLVLPLTTTKYTLRSEEMFQKIAQKCTHLASLIPGNVAFFFPSYNLRDKVGSFITSEKELFWEKNNFTKEEKEVFLNKFKSVKEEGGVLLGVTGANFAEGVDFPGDILNGVVVVGLPLAKPNLKTKEVIKYYDQKFARGWDYGYTFPAMNKCLQSAGRCIRSEEDKGAVIFLDERFAWQRYFCCFPREGLIVSKDYENLLKKFFT